jgi:hypothetical protein
VNNVTFAPVNIDLVDRIVINAKGGSDTIAPSLSASNLTAANRQAIKTPSRSSIPANRANP